MNSILVHNGSTADPKSVYNIGGADKSKSNTILLEDPTLYKGKRDALYMPPEHPDFPIKSYPVPKVA